MMQCARAGVSTLLALLVLSLWLAGDAHGLVRRLDFPALVKKSRLVVAGTVVSMESYRAPYKSLGTVIFTDVRIRVDDELKGAVPAGEDGVKEVTVQVLGGQIGERFQRCPDSPRFALNERVLVFLGDYNDALWTVGWFQGKYTVADDGVTVRGAKELPIESNVGIADVKREVLRLSRTSSGSTGGSR